MFDQINPFSNGFNLGNDLDFGSFNSPTLGQNTIRGRVIDYSTNQPLSAAAVYYTKNGEKVGVITNQNGEYELQASPNDIITISFLGFESINSFAYKLSDTEYLYPKNEQLEEVVIDVPKEKTSYTGLITGLGILGLIVVVFMNSSETPVNIETAK